LYKAPSIHTPMTFDDVLGCKIVTEEYTLIVVGNPKLAPSIITGAGAVGLSSDA
jgi:hypothetical protein